VTKVSRLRKLLFPPRKIEMPPILLNYCQSFPPTSLVAHSQKSIPKARSIVIMEKILRLEIRDTEIIDGPIDPGRQILVEGAMTVATKRRDPMGPLIDHLERVFETVHRWVRPIARGMIIQAVIKKLDEFPWI
jgi:hypothetical protein